MQRFAEQSQKKCRLFSAFPLRLSVFASKFVNFQTDSENRTLPQRAQRPQRYFQCGCVPKGSEHCRKAYPIYVDGG
jgi:hypothetical protein